MKLKNNQLIDTTPGRLYTVTCAVDVSVYEMDGAVQGLKLLDYKAADGQKEFRATSLQVKIVTGSASEVQGSVTEVFKGAPALASAGGGMDIIPQDGGVYGVTYVDGQYKGVAVDRKPLIDKTVYDDISQMTQVLPPGTYDFEVACLAVSEATGGTNWQEYYKLFEPYSTATADISDPTITELVDLVSAIGAEYLLSSTSYVGTEVRSPLKIGPQGLYLSYVNNTEIDGAVFMANTTVRLKIKQTTTITFSNLISKMFALAIRGNWMKSKCVPHVIKVYPV